MLKSPPVILGSIYFLALLYCSVFNFSVSLKIININAIFPRNNGDMFCWKVVQSPKFSFLKLKCSDAHLKFVCYKPIFLQ